MFYHSFEDTHVGGGGGGGGGCSDLQFTVSSTKLLTIVLYGLIFFA